RDDGIRSCGLSITRRQVEQIHRLRAIRVSENTDLRLRIQDGPRPVHLARLAEFFVVYKEECLVADDRASKAEAVLVEQHSRTRRFSGCRIGRKVTVVEPVVGIEHRIAMVFVDTSVNLVCSLASDEFDLRRSHGATLRLWCGRGDRDFLYGVQARRYAREKAV